MTPASRFAPLAAGALLALPVLAFPCPPMLDLPLHAVAIGVMRHWGDAAYFPPDLYRLNLGHPNQLFHVAAWALSYAMPVVVACRVVVAAAVLAIPVAAGRLADHVGASRWTAVLASPVAMGWLFVMGLVANLLGLAAFLAVLPGLDRFVEAPTRRRAAGVVGACVLLYFAHEAMLLVYAGALALFTVARTRDARAVAVRLAALVPAAAMVLGQLALRATVMTEWEREQPFHADPLGERVVDVPTTLFAPFDAASAGIVAVVVAVGLALFAAARARASREGAGAPPTGPFARLEALRFEALVVALLVLYLAFPTGMAGRNLLHQRFLAPAFVLAAVLCGRRAGAPRLAPLVASIAPVAAIGVVLPAFAQASREYGDVLRLTSRMAPASAVASVALGGDPETSHEDSLRPAMQCFAIVERGGRLLNSFMETAISPVMIRPEHAWDEPVRRLGTRHEGFCPSYDATRFRYVFARVPDAAFALATIAALAPEERFVARAGDWVLFESTRPVAPLLAPDGPGPGATCAGGLLVARVNAALAELRARAARGDALPALPPEAD